MCLPPVSHPVDADNDNGVEGSGHMYRHRLPDRTPFSYMKSVGTQTQPRLLGAIRSSSVLTGYFYWNSVTIHRSPDGIGERVCRRDL